MAQCSRCHALVQAEDQYCGHCGQHLAQPAWRQELAHTQRALSLADVHYNLGLVYARKGQYLEALAAWERALERTTAGDALHEKIAGASEEVRRHLEEGPGNGGNDPPRAPETES